METTKICALPQPPNNTLSHLKVNFFLEREQTLDEISVPDLFETKADLCCPLSGTGGIAESQTERVPRGTIEGPTGNSATTQISQSNTGRKGDFMNSVVQDRTSKTGGLEDKGNEEVENGRDEISKDVLTRLSQIPLNDVVESYISRGGESEEIALAGTEAREMVASVGFDTHREAHCSENSSVQSQTLTHSQTDSSRKWTENQTRTEGDMSNTNTETSSIGGTRTLSKTSESGKAKKQKRRGGKSKSKQKSKAKRKHKKKIGSKGKKKKILKSRFKEKRKSKESLTDRKEEESEEKTESKVDIGQKIREHIEFESQKREELGRKQESKQNLNSATATPTGRKTSKRLQSHPQEITRLQIETNKPKPALKAKRHSTIRHKTDPSEPHSQSKPTSSLKFKNKSTKMSTDSVPKPASQNLNPGHNPHHLPHPSKTHKKRVVNKSPSNEDDWRRLRIGKLAPQHLLLSERNLSIGTSGKGGGMVRRLSKDIRPYDFLKSNFRLKQILRNSSKGGGGLGGQSGTGWKKGESRGVEYEEYGVGQERSGRGSFQQNRSSQVVGDLVV